VLAQKANITSLLNRGVVALVARLEENREDCTMRIVLSDLFQIEELSFVFAGVYLVLDQQNKVIV
jgi:hypothetical protein